MIIEQTHSKSKPYIPVLQDVVTIKTDIPLSMLNHLRIRVQEAEGWNFKHGSEDFKNRHAKLYLHHDSPLENIKTLGFSEFLLMTIYENGGKNYFKPIMVDCAFSIKDKYRIDNIHTDPDIVEDAKCLKILGILNTDWKEEWGGQFEWNGKKYPLRPGEFLIFDANVPHRASDIYTDEKRIAVDFSVIAI